MTEVAKKGGLARFVLTAVTLVLVGIFAFLLAMILNGYWLTGKRGGLVLPTLLLLVYAFWQLRLLIRHAHSGNPLIFALDGYLNYVALGHATVRIKDVSCYAITGQSFARLRFYAADNSELRRYPLFLSGSSHSEVVERLASLGLHPCSNVKCGK